MSLTTHANPPAIIKYNPQLDGLRFIAVFGVVCYHWLPFISHLEISFFFGGLVNFFFVLSSYLITKILFSAQNKSSQSGLPGYQVFLFFLFRRTIRIFPAYYVFLVIVMLIPGIGTEVREHAGMYFAYLANYHIFIQQTWPLVTSHIWTLAVEEQFYLIWPLIIIFIPKKYLLKTFLTIISVSVLSRILFYHPGTTIPQIIMTQFCLDPFAIGGLLAYQYNAPENERKKIQNYITRFLYIAVPLAISIIIFKVYMLSFIINGLVFSLVSMKVIEGAINGYRGFVKGFLENRFVVFIGRISYGIYLYHLLVPIIFWKIYDLTYGYLNRHNADFFIDNARLIDSINSFLSFPVVYFFIYTGFSILLALISWHVVEIPFNKLKDNFRFGQKKGK